LIFPGHWKQGTAITITESLFDARSDANTTGDGTNFALLRMHEDHEVLSDTVTLWPRVSVIVPCFNDSIRLRACLASLQHQDYPLPPQIIVIDNNLIDECSTLLDSFPRIAFLRESKIGSYNARNAGVEASKGEVVAFTDSDCVPERDWIIAGVKALMGRGRPQLVGGRIEVDPLSPAPSIDELFDFATSFPQKYTIEWRGYCVTANLFVWRRLFSEIGMFDGKLRSGGDGEFTSRAVKAGYRLAYADRAVVRHAPKTNHQEILKRLKRITAGARDLSPGWLGCLIFVMKSFVPVLELAMLLNGRGKTLSAREKSAIFVYAYKLRLLRAYERTRLQFDQSESPRS
jgi:glycosyltransferase involved in cell wall biosynthesis